MRMSERDLICSYIINEYGRLENDVQYDLQKIRFGSFGDHDVAHLQIMRCRFDAFRDFANNILLLLSISDKDIVDFYGEYMARIRREEGQKPLPKRFTK